VCFQNEISVGVAKKNTNQRNTLQIRFQSGLPVEENRAYGEEKNRARGFFFFFFFSSLLLFVVLRSRALRNSRGNERDEISFFFHHRAEFFFFRFKNYEKKSKPVHFSPKRVNPFIFALFATFYFYIPEKTSTSSQLKPNKHTR
jgi:hypothetical protein